MTNRATTDLPLPLTKSDRDHFAAEKLAARIRAQEEERALRVANDERREQARLALVAAAAEKGGGK